MHFRVLADSNNIETGVNFTVEYGDMWEQYYTALENNFDKAMEFIYKNGYLEELRPRIEKMLKTSEECVWGFPDTFLTSSMRHPN